MKFEMIFDCDNAAFDDAPASEIARILREVAGKVAEGELPEWPHTSRPIQDDNGNTIGHWRVGQ